MTSFRLFSFIVTAVFGWASARAEVSWQVPYFNGTGFGRLDLDPDKVFEIQIVHLGAGQSIASRNGHILTRLVRCRPERTRQGPECRGDVEQHIALSYNGFIDTPSTSVAKGIGFGDYAYERFLKAMPFEEMIEKYTFEELRDANAYALTLTAEEKRRVIRHMLEDFWARGHSFRLLKDNCTTLTLDALRAGAPLSFATLNVLSPNGLRRELLRRGLVPADAEKFASLRPQLESAFNGFRPLIARPAKNFQKWIALSSASERREVYATALARRGESARPSLRMFEHFVEARSLRQARSEFLRIAQRRCGGAHPLDPACAKLEEAYLNAGMQVFPNFFLRAGRPLHGIPEPAEFDEARFQTLPAAEVTGLPEAPDADFMSAAYVAARIRLTESRALLQWLGEAQVAERR